MASVNKVIIVGNLGADPDVKRFDNGGMIANISVATSERWTDRQTGEQRELTEWHRITFNNRLAEIAEQYLRKGSQVYIEGSLRTRKWQDQNGQDRWSTEIRAQSMQMLGGRQEGGMNQSGGMSQGGGYQNNNQNNGGFNQQNQGGYQNNNNQNNSQNMANNGAAPAGNAPPPPAVEDDDLPF